MREEAERLGDAGFKGGGSARLTGGGKSQAVTGRGKMEPKGELEEWKLKGWGGWRRHRGWG